MPMELRKIFFSNEEVEAATRNYCIRSGKPLPSADKMYATFKDDIEAMVTLHFCRSDRRDPIAVSLSRAEVRDALIAFCKEVRIPLPRAGKKVLWPQSDGISLMITLECVCDWPVPSEMSLPTAPREKDANGPVR